MRLTLQIDKETISEFLEGIEKGGKRALYSLLTDFLSPEVVRMAAFIKREEVKKFSSGDLYKGIEGRVVRVSGVPSASVGVFKGKALKYAAVQEQGTRPPSSKSPFPLIKSKRPRGALAFPVVKEAQGVRAKDFPGLKYVRFKAKRGSPVIGMLVRTRDRSSRINLSTVNAVYLIMAYVRLSPKRYLSRGMDRYYPIFARRLEKFMEEHLDA